MDGNYSFPPLSEWPPQYDPAHAGFGDISPWLGIASQPSVPSQPARPSKPRELSDADIDALMFPVAPGNPLNLTVIGIYTGGPSTGNKKYLKGIYERAGIPFQCHSCGKDLSGEEIIIGDHQPPTKLREKAAYIDPKAPGIGIYGRIVSRIYCGQQLTLYRFSCSAADPDDGRLRTVKLQTNNPQIIEVLGGRYQDVVTYSPRLREQYLYPHCEECSNRQGKGMM